MSDSELLHLLAAIVFAPVVAFGIAVLVCLVGAACETIEGFFKRGE